VLVYAYGFSATEVNLDQIRDETRRDRLENILRALARPELIEYDEDETNTDLAFAMPCGETDDVVVPEPGDRYLVATPDCAEPRSEVTIEGFGFSPNRELSLYFVPASEVELRLAQVRADGAGHFSTVVRLPNRPAETDQTIRAISIETVGAPRFTQTARDTLDKIIETVFLALIATTFATLLSVPLSFLAARNLMRDISSPIANVALGLIAAPLGVVAGVLAAGRAAALTSPIDSPLLAIAILVVTALIVWRLVRFALPGEETARPPVAVRTIRVLALATAAVGTLVALYLLAFLSLEVGEWLAARLGFMAFLGSFIATMGELLEFGTVVLAALVGAAVLVIVANRLGHAMRRRLPRPTMQALNLPLGALAGAVVAMLIARAIAWFYEWTDPARTLWIPAIAGAIIGIALAVRSMRRDAVGIGLGIYYVTRTIFNVLRAIEPLIMAIVFVVWVGIGPFAGALALALHTIAALAKLYSEQVESISAGPLEAIRATGANRLQTVVYAVVPQVVPPYISFTMYRWDINVRMSTIIGFVGGGGIGFLLQQNINLLNYPAAAAQILAIAIVVSAMDWLSSKVRERYV
jgi:phosphonate ABC transporter permease subunit PhnE